LSPACLTALLKTRNSLLTYAYVYNVYSDLIENADHQYDRQLQSFNEICKVERLHAVLQITSAQQHPPIRFILPHLKLNRTGCSTRWRRKYKTRSIRSTQSHRLTTRI